MGGTLSYDETVNLRDDVEPRLNLGKPSALNPFIFDFEGRHASAATLDASGDLFAVNFGDRWANYPDSYRQDGLWHQGREVKRFVDLLNNATAKPVDVVAHSMGGLALRRYLADAGDAPSKVKRVVTYGTPHWGVKASTLLGAFGQPIDGSGGARDMDFDCASGRISYVGLGGVDNWFLEDLRHSTIPPEVAVATIGGRASILGNLGLVGGCSDFSDLIVTLSSSSLFAPIDAPLGQEQLVQSEQRLVTNRRHTEQTSDATAILCGLNPKCLVALVESPVDLDVEAPSGRRQRSDLAEIPFASYVSFFGPKGDEPSTVIVPLPETGDYRIRLTPKAGSAPDATYTLRVSVGGVDMLTVKDQKLSEIPPDGFSVSVDTNGNRAPTVTLGADISVEATSAVGAAVHLTASAASDPDGDPLLFTWTGPFGTLVGPSVEVTLPLGANQVTLAVSDGRGGVASDSVVVSVKDTTAPAVAAPAPVSVVATEPTGARGSASPALGAFLAGATAKDVADPSPIQLAATVNGAVVNNSSLFAIGTSTVTFSFRDASGNVGRATSQVTVTQPPPTCAVDFTSSVRINLGPVTLDKKTGRYAQNAQVKNTGPVPIQGPVSFVIDGLLATVRLSNQEGVTKCVAPLGSPYVRVKKGTDPSLGRGETVTVPLEFTAPSSAIVFQPRILAGVGPR
jgi:pimeloyl-ACP methyl ester carboxylesterase